MPSKVEIRDLGIGALRAQLAELARTRVTFGYQGETGAAPHPGTPDKTVARIAAYAEEGTETSPPRPLGAYTMETNRDAFAAATKRAISDLVDGREKSLEVAVEQVGQLALTALRKTIDKSREWAAANAASTIRAKGHDQPLIGGFATLYENASWAVRVDGVIVKQSESTGD